MTVDPAVVPGFLLLLAELAALAAVGYVVARVALRQTDDRMALAQGLVVGLALWALITNFALYVAPGLAGAAVGWGVTLTLAAVLVWRAPERIRPEPRVAAGFVVVVLALWWVGLAGRQLLELADWKIHLGLSAWIRAGGFPPELPWNPGVTLRYHHGIDLLIGLLAPPFGPDRAFTFEMIGVHAWMSFALVVVTALMRRGTWRIALLLAPLLLSYGLWTWQAWGPGILQGPVPAGLPAAGLRASLADIYWPSLVWEEPATLPDIWKPSYTLGYALMVVVLERAARGLGRSWPGSVTLAGLVGALGLLVTSLTPVVGVLWAGLEAVELGQAWRARTLTRRHVLRSGGGLALAAVALLLSGGRFTGILDGSVSSGLVWRWDGDPGDWRVLGVFETLPGGVGLLALGPVVVAALAAGLARRDRLVLALALGAGLLALAWVALRYEPFPLDHQRLAGHARNLALVALVLALSARLAELRPRWRYAVSALLVALVIWPTSATQVRHLGLALGQGIEVANAGWAPPTTSGKPTWGRERTAMPEVSAPVAAYIRDHTAVDARVLMPEPPYLAVTYATGRPNSVGYLNIAHLIPHRGPEYADARDHLEPGAMRRLGIDYVYATDDWVAGLPDRARGWLADPELFELLVRDGGVTLYGVRPAFLALNVAPTPATYEALRRAVPAGAKVYWPDGAPFETVTTLRVASVLSPEAELFGVMRFMLRRTYALTTLPAERLTEQTPDLVILPVGQRTWMSRRWPAPDLVEPGNGHLRAARGRGPGHAAAAGSRAAADRRARVGRAGGGRPARLHPDGRRSLPGPLDRPGLGPHQRRRVALGDPQALGARPSHARGGAMVRRPGDPRARNDDARLRLRCPDVQPGRADWRRRIPDRAIVGRGGAPRRLVAGAPPAARGGPRLRGARGGRDDPGAESDGLPGRRRLVSGLR